MLRASFCTFPRGADGVDDEPRLEGCAGSSIPSIALTAVSLSGPGWCMASW